MLGLKDQPRAIACHIDEKTGEEHIHIAWSRIDDQTMTAKALPFFKERLKKLSRELEMHFGITLVPNERDGAIKYAPTRAEDEQARRLGLDAHTVRETIRYCYERSDCGRSFEAALAEEGMVLARGERRDFVVIDQAGGTHALGKRILGVTAAQTRERLSDLPREQLPSVDQAKEFVREQTTTRQQEKTAPVWDRDRDDIAWQNAIVAAAIEKAKEDAAREAAEDRRPLEVPEHLKGAAAEIWRAYNRSDSSADFAAALKEQGVELAGATKEEADRSHREAAFARAAGRFSPEYGEGEIVAVSKSGRVFRLNARTTGDDRAAVEKFLSTLDRKELRGIDETKQVLRANLERDDEVRARWITGPQRGGMVEHQSWALEFMNQRTADDEHRRRQLDERARTSGQTQNDRVADQEFDVDRYLTDPSYRFEIRARERQNTTAEQRTSREEKPRDLDERER